MEEYFDTGGSASSSVRAPYTVPHNARASASCTNQGRPRSDCTQYQGQYHNTTRRARGGQTSNSGNRGQFRYDNSNRKVITISSNMVGRVIGKGGGKIRDLEYETDTKVKIGDSSGETTEISLFGTDYAITKVERMINVLVDQRQPHSQRQNSSADTTDAFVPIDECILVNTDGIEVVNWVWVNTVCDKYEKERHKSLPTIRKHFYREDPAVTNMTEAEVFRWRFANYDMKVNKTFKTYYTIQSVPNPITTFGHAFQDYPEILRKIYKQGFKQPLPIQSQAWPILLQGEDMIGIAQTGTGKTLAFLLPALIHIDGQPTPREEREGPTVLIIVPSRELALQIDREVFKYQYRGIKSICIYEEGNKQEQIYLINKGVDIVIATPGRLCELISSRHLHAINFSYIVLDEADRLLDRGFEYKIRKSLIDVRSDRQTVITSVTWPSGMGRLVQSYLKNPIQVNIGSLELAAVHTVTQKIIFVEDEDKERNLYEFIDNMKKKERVMIFCANKATATHIISDLALREKLCHSMYGDKYQSEREAALIDVIAGTINIIVATDISYRGIDIKDLTHVINFDFPRQIEEYVHRVGRTGRVGKKGIAISYITERDAAHASELIKILQKTKQEVPTQLQNMAYRFEAIKLQKERNAGMRHGRGGRGGRGRSGGHY